VSQYFPESWPSIRKDVTVCLHKTRRPRARVCFVAKRDLLRAVVLGSEDRDPATCDIMFRKDGIESRASISRDPGVLWAITVDLREGTEVEDDFYTFGDVSWEWYLLSAGASELYLT
jgi:hypothetical protein